MNETPPTPTRELLRITQPWLLLAGLLTFMLGARIALYLGAPLKWSAYLAGQAIVLLLLLSAYFLKEYFDRPPELASRRIPGDPPRLTRANLMQIAATALTIGAVLTVMLFSNAALSPSAFVVLGIGLLLVLAYAVPPLRLAQSGYGELINAFLIANFSPTLAFLLLQGDLHRLLAFLTFPLTFLAVAAGLALRMQTYGEDTRVERKNILTRAGWQRGISLHNLFILAGFLVLVTATLTGLPWRLAWPGLLGLPIGVFQIVQMQLIAAGGRPRWRLLNFTAAGTFFLTTYFLILALWNS